MKKRDVLISKAVFGQEEKDAVMKVLDNGWLGPGEESRTFERRMADYIGVNHGMFVNSGSSALLLGLKSLGIPQGAEVITCAAGFPSTLSPIIHAGYMPVLVDCELDTMNIDPQKVKEAVTDKTGALVFAHAAGNVCDMKGLEDVLDAYPSVEDACLVAGTKVKTSEGDMNIEEIKKGDYVLTRKGYKKVLYSKMTGYKNVITRFGITGTPDHPVITDKGLVRLDALNLSDKIYVWNEKQLFIEEKNIIDIQMPPKDKEGFIFGGILNVFRFLCIGRFGLTTMGIFLKSCMFIIKMEINLIMTYPISNLLLPYHMPAYTSQIQDDWNRQAEILNSHKAKHRNGTRVKMGENGIKNMERSVGLIKKNLQKYAISVVKNIKLIFLKGQNTALPLAKINIVPVFNLLIEDAHEFFANNILVHNCDCLGGSYKSKMVGSFGTVSAFSFFASHHITAAGGGGMVLTNEESRMTKMFSMRDWGKRYISPTYYQRNFSRYDTMIDGIPYDLSYSYDTIGFNMKLIELGAAFANAQMNRLPDFINKRNENFHYLYEQFYVKRDFSKFFIPPRIYDGNMPSWFFFVFILRDGVGFTRKEFGEYLEDRGIHTRPFFAGNILRQPALKRIPARVVGTLDNANKLMEDAVMIGVHPGLTDSDREYVVEVVEEFVHAH